MAQLVITMVSLVILLASLYGLGTSSTIEIQTDSTQGMMNNQVNISCVPDGKEIIVMEIVKGEDNPIATIRHISDSISYGTGMKKNFQVEGHLSRDKAPDYLQLTITNPALSDLGRYQCVMFYVNGEGQLKEERINRNLTLEDLDILMLVNYLMTKVSNLEDTILDQKQTMEDQGTKLENWNKHLKKQENWNKVHEDLGNKLENQLNDQHDQLMNQHDQLLNQSHQVSALKIREQEHDDLFSNQSLMMNNLVEKDAHMTAFSAWYQPHDTFTTGDVLRFKNVNLNVGEAYNGNTGLFKTKKAGYYVFHLVLLYGYGNNQLSVQLVADGNPVAETYTVGKTYLRQTSVSAVVKLEKGQEVKPVVKYANGNVVLEYSYPMASEFTGYLIKAL